MALFGVDAETRPLCTLRTTDGCTPVLSTVNEHVIWTGPSQTIPPVDLTTVTAPNPPGLRL